MLLAFRKVDGKEIHISSRHVVSADSAAQGVLRVTLTDGRSIDLEDSDRNDVIASINRAEGRRE